MAAKKKTKKKTAASRKSSTGKKTARKRKSKSHRQGWVTRKLNRQEAVLLHAVRKGNKTLLKKLLGLDIPEWIRKMPPELAKQYAELSERIREEGWLPVQDPEYTYSGKRGAHKYERGAIAVSYSRARHLGKATDEALKMMRAANKKGARELDRAVQRISQALDLPIKEIYTLWFSP